MGENRKPLSLKEGHIYIDGVEVMDAVNHSVRMTWKTNKGGKL